MRSNTSAILVAIAAISLCLVSTVTTLIYHQRVLDRIQSVERDIQQQQEEDKMLTTTWMSGGDEVACSTPRLDGEAADVWANRHKVAVDACKEVFPKDP